MKLSKIAVACLALCLVGSAVPVANIGEMPVLIANASYYGNLIYHNCDTYISITGCDIIAESIEIPEEIDGFPVTEIWNEAFCGCRRLESITIPNSVIEIKERAFDGTPWLRERQEENPLVVVNNILIDATTCSGDVVIPEGVTRIADTAFLDCQKLTSVTIPDSVKSIGAYAFYNCSNLNSIIIPKTVEVIYDAAFNACNMDVTILNPECKFSSVSWGIGAKRTQYKLIVYGYENSTAQTYFTTEANNNSTNTEYEFRIIGQESPEDKISGDLNGDGDLTVSDLVEFGQKLRNREALPKNCDLNGDEIVNVIDLALLKRALLNK